MKIEKTYLQLITYNAYARAYLSVHTEENKLSASINKFAKQLQKYFDIYNDEKDTLQLNNCSVDEKGNIIYDLIDSIDDNGKPIKIKNRKYSIEAEKKLKVEIKLLNKTKIIIHQRIADGIEEIIAGLSDMQKSAFSGIIIPEQPIEEE